MASHLIGTQAVARRVRAGRRPAVHECAGIGVCRLGARSPAATRLAFQHDDVLEMMDERARRCQTPIVNSPRLKARFPRLWELGRWPSVTFGIYSLPLTCCRKCRTSAVNCSESCKNEK